MADEDEELDPVEDDEDTDIGDDSDEVTDAVVDGDAETDVEDEDEDEEVTAKPASRSRKLEQVEVHSSAARAALRDTIAADVEAFLKRGGSIEKIATDQRADPPKKPESNYGRGSI